MNIKEVARAAGVSVATISRVLNHPEQVQPETRSHVLKVMEALHYQPNWFARGLNIGKTGTIALLVPSIKDRRFADIITGVETIARQKEHTVLLCDTHAEVQEERRCVKMVLERQVDGLILASGQLEDKDLAPLMKENFPWVRAGGRAGEGCRNLCLINYEKGAFQMTAHLIWLGHRRIALLLDQAPLAEMDAIAKGYRRALRESGLGEGTVLRGENSVQGGYLAAQKLLQSGEAPQAMLTAGDEQAFGVARAAADERVEIPDGMALACLQDSQVCPILNPPVTALELPAHRLGLVAARMLFDCVEGGGEGMGPQEIILQPTLKIRSSCGNTSPIYELFG